MNVYKETGRLFTFLSDKTPIQVVTYDVYDEEDLKNPIAINQLESQHYNSGFYYCWHISATSNVEATNLFDYYQPNATGALPKPKGLNNPGGSPIKY